MPTAPGTANGHTHEALPPHPGSRLTAKEPRPPLPAISSAAAALPAVLPNAVVAVDAKGRISWANPQVLSTFGYTPAELIGKSLSTLVPESGRVSHRHHTKSYFNHPVSRPMGIGLDFAGRHRDGHEFPVEISLAPVDTDAGLQVFATVVDISARKAAENALAESERRFRAVLEGSLNAVLAVDEQGLITYVNPMVEQTFGYSAQELVGMAVDVLLPGGLHGTSATAGDTGSRQRAGRPIGIGMDLVGRHRLGREIPLEIGLSPVPTEGGLQIFATIVDITARKVAEAELLQAQKLESIGRLAGGIAHDFNNVLFAITGYSGMLEEDLTAEAASDGREPALRNVRAIGDAAKRGANLTSQLLAFSRQQVVRARIIAMDDAVSMLEPMLRPLIGEQHELIFNLRGGDARIKIDPGQFDQILVNLVVNARDAMPDGGNIEIETREVEYDAPFNHGLGKVSAGRYAMVSVTDTGEGMDEATRRHAFEPFFTTKAMGKGTGLGLATSYGIVSQAGGHIWLDTEPGLGSVFKVYLPLVTGAADPRRRDAEAPIMAVEHTALVVEDEPAVREITTRLLQRSGYHVVAVASGEEALVAAEGLAGHPIDVLVTDAVMPGMSGMELADKIQSRYPGAALVILSGYTAETLDVERVIARGARFVAKPVTSHALLAAIGDAVADRKVTGQPA